MSQDSSKKVNFDGSSPQVQKIMMDAQEMQQTLSTKLEEFERTARDKAGQAQKDVYALKADLEEIKKLATIKSKLADEELKAKIIEVNKKVDEIAKNAAKEQAEAVEKYRQLMTDMKRMSLNMKQNIDGLNLPDYEKEKLKEQIDSFEKFAEEKWTNAEKLGQVIEQSTLNGDAARKNVLLTKEEAIKKIEGVLRNIESQARASEEYSRIVQEIRDIVAQANANVLNRTDVSQKAKKKFCDATRKYEKEALCRAQNAEFIREDLEVDGWAVSEGQCEEWESRQEVTRKVEYYLIVLSAQCPGVIIQGKKCPASAIRPFKAKTPESVHRWK